MSPARAGDPGGAGRVIAGSARGIRLTAPGTGTRPLGDRVKQTLFAILDPWIRDARVLDLFAGSGAAGIEALSRGAASAVFVEQDAGAIRVIRENLERTHLAADRATVIRAEVGSWLASGASTSAVVPPFDLVIVDPPYEQPALLSAALVRLGPRLSPEGWVVAKHFWRDRPPREVGLLRSVRERRFGETGLTFLRLPASPAPANEEGS